MSRNDFYFESSGYRLRGHSWLSHHPQAPVLVIVHGYTEYSLRYQPLVDFFLDQGFSCFAFDQPGHGESSGKRSSIQNFSSYIEILETFIKTISLSESGKNFIFGHSLGGLVVTRFLETSLSAKLIHRAALSSPMFGLGDYSEKYLPLLRIFTGLIPDITLSNQAVGGEWLTHDRQRMTERLADPLIKSRVSTRWLHQCLKAISNVFDDANKVKHPLGIFQAGDEKITDRSRTEKFYQLIESDKILKIYDDWYHELSNEVHRQIFFQDLLAWYLKS